MSATSTACPVCDTSTGVQVRAGIFGSDFCDNLAAVLLPFLVLSLIVGLIHRGLLRTRVPLK